MKKLLVGLLVGICVLMFASPLLAADSPKGLDLSTLQKVDDNQLSQMKGQGWETATPGLFRQFKQYGGNAPYLNGLNNAYGHLSNNIVKNNGNGPKAFINSRAFAD